HHAGVDLVQLAGEVANVLVDQDGEMRGRMMARDLGMQGGQLRHLAEIDDDQLRLGIEAGEKEPQIRDTLYSEPGELALDGGFDGTGDDAMAGDENQGPQSGTRGRRHPHPCALSRRTLSP